MRGLPVYAGHCAFLNRVVIVKSQLFGVAFGVASLACAASGSATTFNVTSTGIYDVGKVQLSGAIDGFSAYDKTVYAGPIVLQGTTEAGKSFSIVSYCFDLLHPIEAGFGYQAAHDYTYTSGSFSTDQSTGAGSGNLLTTTQIQRMSGLAQLGASLFKSGASDLSARMPAIQAAIWNVEYNLTATSFSNPDALGYYNAYLARSFSGNPVLGLTAANAQGQIIGGQQGKLLAAGTGVPEPTVWGMLIVGFGAVGTMARRRRPLTMVAA